MREQKHKQKNLWLDYRGSKNRCVYWTETGYGDGDLTRKEEEEAVKERKQKKIKKKNQNKEGKKKNLK